MSNFLQRTLTGAVFVSVLLGAIWAGPYFFFLLFFLITTFALAEFYKLVRNENLSPNGTLGIISSSALFITSAFAACGWLHPNFTFLAFGFMLLIFIAELFRNTDQPFRNIAFTILGIVYISLPFSLLNFLAFETTDIETYNPRILTGIFFLQWSSDTGAYLVGRWIGRNKLFERISPKKTWEGLVGGTAAAVAVAVAIAQNWTTISIGEWIIISLLIVVFGTFGDFAESLLKRSIGVKDSGNILPGHGGLLDRFDAFIFSVPAVFVYLALK